MSLTDEQIQAMMQKHITCKTLLVSNDELEDKINEYTNSGWELVNNIECNGKRKITFRKVEKIHSKNQK